MVQENELAMMLIGVWVFFYTRKLKLIEFPEYHYFLAGFYCLLFSWFCTVLETFFFTDYLNLAEHLFYALSATFLLIWCFRAFIRKGGV